MNDGTITGLLRTTVVVGAALAVIGSAIAIAIGHAGSWWAGGGAFLALTTLFFAAFAWFVIPEQFRNPVVWTMAAFACFGGLATAGTASVALIVIDNPDLVNAVINDTATGSDLPLTAAWILVFTAPLWAGSLFTLLTFGLLLFPDGALPSPRWHWVGILAAIGILATIAGLAWGYRPESTVLPEDGALAYTGFLIIAIAAFLSLLAPIRRFPSSGATRQQLKWIMWGASILLATIAVTLVLAVLGRNRYENLTTVAFLVAAPVFIVSYGIAVARYRLYDIDIIVNRTVVYGAVVAILAALYTALVSTAALLPRSDNDLILVASVLIAAAVFNPLRRRIQSFVDTRFYRSHYDVRHITESFAERIRDEVDPVAISVAWIDVVTETLQPDAVGVWIKGP